MLCSVYECVLVCAINEDWRQIIIIIKVLYVSENVVKWTDKQATYMPIFMPYAWSLLMRSTPLISRSLSPSQTHI